MPSIEVRLCTLLLREHFGEVVEKVGSYLMQQLCSRPLRQIAANTSLPPKKVISSLRVLIYHHFCEFSLNKKNIVEYGINNEQVLLLMHYPRYMYCAKILYGDAAELLVEELLNNGRMTMSRAIQKVVERLQEAAGKVYSMKEITFVKNKFAELVEARFLKRCPRPQPNEEDSLIPVMVMESKEEFLVPEIKLYLLGKDSIGEPSVKQKNIRTEEIPEGNVDDVDRFSRKRKLQNTDFANSGIIHDGQPSKKSKSETFPDEGIYWRINNERFHQYFRDEAIVSAVSNIVGRKASEVVRTLLRMSETRSDPWVASTNPIARHEILSVLMKETTIKDNELNSFLSILTDQPYNFVSKADDRSGGMYAVNINNTLNQIVEALTVAVVRDRFGSFSSRIFQLLLHKKHLEQKQIEDFTLISARDAKNYTYKMQAENFVTAREIPRTQDHIPSREIYVFTVDMNQVCRMLLQRCYKQTINAITRFDSINKENKRLLERKQRIDAIVTSLQQSGAESEQIEEVEQMITPSERAVLEKVKNATEKLEACQIQLAEDTFLFKIWLHSLSIK